MPSRRSAWSLGPAAVLSLTLAAWAQAQVLPQGPEFAVSTYTTGFQIFSSAALDADGDFVIAWESGPNGGQGQDGDGFGIFAQRFASDGLRRGAEFQVNETVPGDQRYTSVASASNGDFVVVWSGPGSGDTDGIFGRIYASSGTALTPELLLNETTAAIQRFPAVAAEADGDFVVVWQSLHEPGGSGVFGRRFASSGTPRGGEFALPSETAGNQQAPAVALQQDGGFVVVWESPLDGAGSGIFGRRFTSNAVAVGAEFPVNTQTGGDQRNPVI